MEFSKKITILSWMVAVVLTVLAIVLPLCGAPIDGLQIALPCSWGEVTAVQAFYLWKAKNENRSKYAMRYVDKYGERYDTDTALRLAEIVLKD